MSSSPAPTDTETIPFVGRARGSLVPTTFPDDPLMYRCPLFWKKKIGAITERIDRPCAISRHVEALVVKRGKSMDHGPNGSYNHDKFKTGWKKNYKCYKCDKPSHLKRDCRSLNSSNTHRNVASTFEDGNAMCYEAVANEDKEIRFANV
ncbi:gag-pol polyprotein [Tanacetum coccineum]